MPTQLLLVRQQPTVWDLLWLVLKTQNLFKKNLSLSRTKITRKLSEHSQWPLLSRCTAKRNKPTP